MYWPLCVVCAGEISELGSGLQTLPGIGGEGHTPGRNPMCEDSDLEALAPLRNGS